MATEYERKFRGRTELEPLLRALFSEPRQMQMETTYYDTPDRAFSNRRCTLRRRLENGRSICTLKTPKSDGSRGEWELEAEDMIPASEILCKLSGLQECLQWLRGGLITVCSARFVRLFWEVALEDGTAEVAFDLGQLQGGDRVCPICELEIEQKTCSRAQCDRFAEELARRFALVEETESKFARAMALCREASDGCI